MFDKISNEEVNLFYKNEEGKLPMYDGIVNIEKYTNSKYRVMWICKESYDNDTGKGGYSLVENINKDPKGYATILTLKRIAITSNSILNNCDYVTSINKPNYFESLQQIAFLNINKLPETTSSEGREGIIGNHYNNAKILLFKQIEIAKPHIIIFGGVFHYFLNDYGLSWKDGINLEHQRKSIFIKNNTMLIDAYHPSFRPNRYVNEEKYCDSISNAFHDALLNKRIVI